MPAIPVPLRAENLPEHLASLVHDGEVLWIEVPEGWSAERAEDALRHSAGSRPEKDAFGGVGLRSGGDHAMRLG